MPSLLHHLIEQAATNNPANIALKFKQQELDYKLLESKVSELADSLRSPLFDGQVLCYQDRIAIYLPKQFEAVISMFAASKADGVFVPINPLLKAQQVTYILSNCAVSVLVTSLSRYKQLSPYLSKVPSIKRVILTDCKNNECPENCIPWESLFGQTLSHQVRPSSHSESVAAILYTSGSTGQPKGVVLSHKNLIEGAKSVSQYLQNTSSDRLLAVLPFSFDYGLSQLTTAFLCSAQVVLLEYLLPRDVINAVTKYNITGLAAVPPLWSQLAELEWPKEAQRCLRYITNSGGAMPTSTLSALRNRLPTSSPYLMYGLTEAFRSTYLHPEQIEMRPTSIGKAIPNATILVINSDQELCAPNEPGELVHIGVHVAKGYWNNQLKTDEKFRPLPPSLQQRYGKQKAVWSGDIVTRDKQQYLYFIGRNDDMIKSSGYRISPAELEEVVYRHVSIREVAAIGLNHIRLGHSILLVVVPQSKQSFDEKELRQYLKRNLPNYMQPHQIEILDSLQRNPNGKINRIQLQKQFQHLADT